MPLRLEGHLLLWVAALVSMAAVTMHGTAEPPALQDEARERGASGPSPMASVAKVLGGTHQVYPRVLPNLEASGRPLFAATRSAALVEPVSTPARVEAAPPMLKGVVSDGITQRAVFGVAGEQMSYLTAGPGQLAAGYRIERIEADRVVVASPDGETLVLKLRGAGELP